MPLYEYICSRCRRRSTHFIRSVNHPEAVKCLHCGSDDVLRIMSRFASLKSEEARLEQMADPGRWGGLDENNPASVARFVRKMGEEMGEDVSRDEIEQMADEAAHESETGGDAGETGE